MSRLYEKIYACLCGGIIGDAMGAPVEGKTYGEIERELGWVNTFQGAGTDDSAIKMILCDALLESGGHVTADEWAQSFLRNRRFYPLFYIPVRNMFHKVESGLSLPVHAGLGNMQSSSSAMSISPMGIVNACDPRQAAQETFDAAGLIHAGDTSFCRDGACAIAAAVAEAFSPDATADSVVDAATRYLHPVSSRVLLDTIRAVLELARQTGEYKAFRARFYEEFLQDIVCDSRETVPCVLALFSLAGGDGRLALEYAANLGRDADTIGTMLGAICGAFRGREAFPAAWIEALEKSFGQKTGVSKDYDYEAETMTDQRELAKGLETLVLQRMEERARVQTRVAAVTEA